MKFISLALISFVIMSCSSHSQLDNDIDDSRIGWMHGNCLAIKNQNIPSQYHFTLVHLEDTQIIEDAVITRSAKKSDECYPILDDRVKVNKDAGYYFYVVKSKKPVNLAIGILESEYTSELSFSFCNTTEGMQFSVTKNNYSVWKGYYYLGYESEPTCKEE